MIKKEMLLALSLIHALVFYLINELYQIEIQRKL